MWILAFLVSTVSPLFCIFFWVNSKHNCENCTTLKSVMSLVTHTANSGRLAVHSMLTHVSCKGGSRGVQEVTPNGCTISCFSGISAESTFNDGSLPLNAEKRLILRKCCSAKFYEHMKAFVCLPLFAVKNSCNIFLFDYTSKIFGILLCPNKMCILTWSELATWAYMSHFSDVQMWKAFPWHLCDGPLSQYVWEVTSWGSKKHLAQEVYCHVCICLMQQYLLKGIRNFTIMSESV